MSVIKLMISVLMVSAIFVVMGSQSANASLPLSVDGQRLPSLAPVIERVQSSLVRITVTTPIQARRDPFDDPFFRRFFDQRRSVKNRAREVFVTGVVIDGLQGLI